MESNEITSSSIYTLQKCYSKYCLDSIEWCPHEPYQNVFVCANYHLLNPTQKKQERIGRILLFSVDSKEGLVLKQSLNTQGVLDQKWCHNKINGHSILAVANSRKTIEIYKLCFSEDNIKNFKLEIITKYVITDDKSETLVLSLDWSTGKYESDNPQIICSDSKGNIHRLKFEDNQLELCSSWHAHAFEAWIAAFYYWDTNVVFTGGDDCFFLKFDDRIGDSPVVKNNSHGAGVTSIHSNAKSEFLLATGSYDSYLRLWDIRNMKRPKTDIKMPDTVWRLKWNPHNFELLLVACMRGGVHIVNTNDELKIVESYYEHSNLAYGIDWSYLKENDLQEFGKYSRRFLVGSCSFYDNLLCLWMSNSMSVE